MVNKNEFKDIKVLWDYMQMRHSLKCADCIICLGCSDTNVAKVAADLYLKRYADKIIVSGGLGKITYQLWNETEAEKFSKIIMNAGVPEDDIFLEKQSTNTSDNFRFVRKLIEKEKLNIKSFIIVCKPYDQKRTYAAFKKIMPEYEAVLYSEDISCAEYYKKHDTNWINVLVGDIQRMDVFAKKGWQIEMDVPIKVWDSYKSLVELGYDKFLLPSDDKIEDKKHLFESKLADIKQ